MEIVTISQGSYEWHSWRRKGIGASEASIIMDASKYSTRYKLWEQKTGGAPLEQALNFGMIRGHELEPRARARFELEYDLEMPPVCFQNSGLPWLRASLDGWDEEEKAILEIKCPNKNDHALACIGEIPEKYMWQLAHQLLVTDGRKVYYYSFDGEKGVCVEKSAAYFKDRFPKLLKAEKDFWTLVEKDKAPEFADKDFRLIKETGKKKAFEDLRNAKVELIDCLKKYHELEKIALEDLAILDRQRIGDIKIYLEKDHYQVIFPEFLKKKKTPPCPLKDLWNDHCGKLSKIRGLDGNRGVMARARWREKPDDLYWIDVIGKLAKSSFCNGDNSYKWKADFDFLIKPGTDLKVLEGKYQDKTEDSSTDIDSILRNDE